MTKARDKKNFRPAGGAVAPGQPRMTAASPSMAAVFREFLARIENHFFLTSMLTAGLVSLFLFVELLIVVAAQWLLSRYLLHTAGSRLFRSQRSTYDKLAFAVVTMLNVAGGYYLMLFALRMLHPKELTDKLALAAVTLVLPCFLAFQLAGTLSFSSVFLAALPPVLAFALGIAAALRVPEADNLFNKIKLD
ncbi:MAG: hypothetical protein PHW69_09340 [Elusimicrobiaceae bacterium]|nr:hypothetical protein [Elusimicrobiaceae bacterium]